MIDKNKKYRTRDGREVRIYATDGEPGAEIHGAFHHPSGDWVAIAWDLCGRASFAELDLVEARNPRFKRNYWINVYNTNVVAYPSKEEANVRAMSSRIACVRVEIDCEEGDGL